MSASNPYLGLERTSIFFEWQLADLRNLLDSTKGEMKSKFTESPLFGNGKWRVGVCFLVCPIIPDQVNLRQISFLANSGLLEESGTATEGEYVGLFLTCQVGSTQHGYWNN